jgi:hypothetical protein
MRILRTALCLVVAAASAAAQSNTIDGLDAYLLKCSNPRTLGRKGTFPSGVNGLGLGTTICNTGTQPIQWKAAMDPNHPVIAFIVARDYQGHFEQITTRSFVKHNFGASNASDCSRCTDTSDSTVLAVGCSDTYLASEAGDRYWLGPSTEIDPWLATWTSTCSYFDQGDPPDPPPGDCDDVRSLTSAEVGTFDQVKNRIQVTDGDFNVSGASFYFYSWYVIQGEAESLREDSSGSRAFTPSWNGSKWTLTASGSTVNGTPLQRWSGAAITSNTNGGDDGRVFIGVVVTGPDAGGMYHYEYALHNRDNGHGISEFHLPICPGASVTNVGFHDVDSDATNDWTFATHDTEVAWTTTSNPLEWNEIFSFWFDSDTAPGTGAKTLLTEARAGGGLPAIEVATTAPTGPLVGTDLGYGKAGANGLTPDFSVCGGLDAGESAEVVVRYTAPQAIAFLVIGTQSSPFPYRGGMLDPFPPLVIDVTTTNGDGAAWFSFDGTGDSYDLFAQYVVDDVGASQGVALSNALEVVH